MDEWGDMDAGRIFFLLQNKKMPDIVSGIQFTL
jgi:hypothetical protein